VFFFLFRFFNFWNIRWKVLKNLISFCFFFLQKILKSENILKQKISKELNFVYLISVDKIDENFVKCQAFVFCTVGFLWNLKFILLVLKFRLTGKIVIVLKKFKNTFQKVFIFFFFPNFKFFSLLICQAGKNLFVFAFGSLAKVLS